MGSPRLRGEVDRVVVTEVVSPARARPDGSGGECPAGGVGIQAACLPITNGDEDRLARLLDDVDLRWGQRTVVDAA